MVPNESKLPRGLARRMEIRNWHGEFQKSKPILYFFTETMPNRIRALADDLEQRWCEIQDLAYNYFIYRADRLETGVKRQDYYNIDDLLLLANFNQLVKYVEETCALKYVSRKFRAAIDEPDQTWYRELKRIKRYSILHLRPYRNRDYGLQYLQDRIKFLASIGREDSDFDRYVNILVMYVWWTAARPGRKDPEQASGLNDFKAQMDQLFPEYWSYSKLTPAQQQRYRSLMAECEQILADRETEDTEMLCRLMQSRQSIWGN